MGAKQSRLANDNQTNSFVEIWSKERGVDAVTSDHVLVINRFEFIPVKQGLLPVSMRVATWNLMNKAHSKENCKVKGPDGKGLYANTPEENLDETPVTYLERKRIQLDKIVELLKKQDEPRLDALFLQEIDVFTLSESSVSGVKNLKNTFIKDIKAAGYNIVITDSTLGDCKPQAIIYNKKTLKAGPQQKKRVLIPPELVGVSGLDQRKTLFEAHFEHVKSKSSVVLASAHLAYNGDYSEVLSRYSFEQSRENRFVIWGGDTNHAPGNAIRGLIGDFTQATNYDFYNGKYVCQHTNDFKGKAYDGFGCCPIPGYVARVIEEPGQRFKLAAGDKVTLEAYQPSHPVHLSFPGFPWMRRQEILLDILGLRSQMLRVLKDLQPSDTANQLREQVRTAPELRLIESLLNDVAEKEKAVDDQSRCLPERLMAELRSLVMEGDEMLENSEKLGKALSTMQQRVQQSSQSVFFKQPQEEAPPNGQPAYRGRQLPD